MNDAALEPADLYISRELSQLAFNWRVLAQAKDESTPLLERVRFLCISSTNLDEFFEIRVAGLMQRLEIGAGQPSVDMITPAETLKAISVEARKLVAEQYRVLNEILIPELQEKGIRIIRRGDWTVSQKNWLCQYFHEDLLPVLSPLGLDPAHPFPRILNKSLNFIVALEGKDAFGRNSGLAVVQAPRSLPRLIQLPPHQEDNGPNDFVFLTSVIHSCVDDLFPGMQVTGCYQFRVTRNSDLFVDDEEVDDIMHAVQGELIARRYGDAVRLETAHDCPAEVINFLLNHFELSEQNLYRVNGPVNLNRLQTIYGMVERADLVYQPFTPALPTNYDHNSNMFDLVRRRDILLHHPYESFLPVLEFVRQAAQDAQVLAIKQTLYRTGADSAIVDTLVSAAQAGKEVTVVIELRARFDEAENIVLANRLQEAGAHVVYGVVGFKTHAKMIMVVRREGTRLVRYAHLGTGNYHPGTARSYTDYGLFTADPDIGEDVHRVFLQLTGPGKALKLRKLIQSPFSLHAVLIEMIEREAAFATEGKAARIIIKVNALIEPQIIQALYRASTAGVKIHLIVRGMCSLRPGVKSISENIHVRSIIGRFLEHSRVYYFHNGGKPDVFCSSADWMERNFFRRVELCFPILDRKLKNRVIHDLKVYLRDNTHAWVLETGGNYRLLKPRGTIHSAQAELLAETAARSTSRVKKLSKKPPK